VEKSIHRLIEVSDCKVGRLAQILFVAALNEDCPTTGRARTINVPPSITDDVTRAKINFQVTCCSQDQAWSRLAAIARLAITLACVITDLDAIKRWQYRPHFQMHRFDRFTTLFAAADIGLVGNHNQQEVRCLKPGAAGNYVIVELESFNTRWRTGVSVPDDSPIEHSIAIKEDCAPPYVMLSHFVSASFNRG
jgi:hypothetical protein